MTQALCFRCGQVKFGTLCRCAACGAGPTDSIEFDILFTDHYLLVTTLRRFGAFVRELIAASPSSDTAFWAFVRFLSERHPSIASSLPVELGTVVQDLAASTPDDLKAPVAELLRRVEVPTIVVQHRGEAPVSQQTSLRLRALGQCVVGLSGCGILLALAAEGGAAAGLAGLASLVPGAWGLAGLLALVTGRPFSETAMWWDGLKGWQRGVYGMGVVLTGLLLMWVVARLVA